MEENNYFKIESFFNVIYIGIKEIIFGIIMK